MGKRRVTRSTKTLTKLRKENEKLQQDLDKSEVERKKMQRMKPSELKFKRSGKYTKPINTITQTAKNNHIDNFDIPILIPGSAPKSSPNDTMYFVPTAGTPLIENSSPLILHEQQQQQTPTEGPPPRMNMRRKQQLLQQVGTSFVRKEDINSEKTKTKKQKRK